MRAMPAWQMPQGGIDPGETPRQAALRELEEEIGTDKAEIIAESREWLTTTAGRARRQGVGRALSRPAPEMVSDAVYRQRRAISTWPPKHPEFDAWQWVAPDELPELIVPFKRQLYIDVLDRVP